MKPVGDINSAFSVIIPARESERPLRKIANRRGGTFMPSAQNERTYFSSAVCFPRPP